MRDAERDRQYQEYKDRIGEIVNGVVKRVEYGNVIVDLGRGEAIVRRDELIPRETFRPGDRIRAYLFDVRREVRGPQIFLSRTHPQFMAKLFGQEVPEIYDGIVEVKAVARDPGSRAKIAVISRDSSIDPVGACVGMRGSRVQAVVGELQGEKIDIIPWSPDQATFIVNALQPAEVVKVVLDEEADRIEVVVPDDQLSLAIGRRGQNVRLASQLTGWDIDILTEAEESERRQKEFAERTELFMNALDVDEVVGQLLASEGFRSVEEVAFVEPPETRLDRGLRRRTPPPRSRTARAGIPCPHRGRAGGAPQGARRRRRAQGGRGRDDRRCSSPSARTTSRRVEDLAGCATDDLVGWTEGQGAEAVRYKGSLDGFELSREDAEAIIMAARVKAGWIEAASPEEPAEAETEARPPDSAEAALARPRGSRLGRHSRRRSGISVTKKTPEESSIAAPRTGTHVHRQPRSAPGRGADPVRRRAGRRGRAGPQAQAAGARRLGECAAPRPSRRPCGASFSAAHSRPRRRFRRHSSTEIGQLMRADLRQALSFANKAGMVVSRLCESRGGDRRKASRRAHSCRRGGR